MTFLLKVKSESLSGGVAVVPRMKSAALVAGDVGATVFVWLGDDQTEKSAIHARATLGAFEEIMVPQVRDTTKRKHAFRIELAHISTDVVFPLTTDDLEPYRYVESVDGIESLGRIHRDRNDKIIRLNGAEAAALAGRFQN